MSGSLRVSASNNASQNPRHYTQRLEIGPKSSTKRNASSIPEAGPLILDTDVTSYQVPAKAWLHSPNHVSIKKR